MFFFFKQKTAYEMRISDWSSDVCSSDLLVNRLDIVAQLLERRHLRQGRIALVVEDGQEIDRLGALRRRRGAHGDVDMTAQSGSISWCTAGEMNELQVFEIEPLLQDRKLQMAREIGRAHV